MYFEEEENLPTLVPLNKKKRETHLQELQQKDKKIIGNELINVFQKEGKQSKQQDIKNPLFVDKEQKEDQPKSRVKIEDIQGRFKATNELIAQKQKKQKKEQFKNSDKWKDIQKSKKLVAEIMNKINAKNISQELYPVTNETIYGLLKRMDQQISELKAQQQRKQNSYLVNPTNQHLKKQLDALKSSIDRATTIKQLYNEKIHLRNKIMILEKNIIGLKEENHNLKIKINRGIETIQNHMHNLPCEKEKQLKIELNKLQANYEKEREMRQKLEINVSEIVLNFKRLFEEAETARLTVTRKLTEIQQKERAMTTTPHNAPSDDKSSIINPSEISHIDRKIKGGDGKLLGTSSDDKTPKKILLKKQTDTTKQKEPGSGLFSMQQQIRKMRNNQLTIKKVK